MKMLGFVGSINCPISAAIFAQLTLPVTPTSIMQLSSKNESTMPSAVHTCRPVVSRYPQRDEGTGI